MSSCDPGYYLNATNYHTICPPGYYCPGGMDCLDIACPSGKTSVEGSSLITDCRNNIWNYIGYIGLIFLIIYLYYYGPRIMVWTSPPIRKFD